eukprot:CAMPEP_0170150894 /NCGR_PEP_ID=MMETSP0033_2-20121228/47926_1 /TAXON_ID=195969 /ORGANISM="Dolichomastix tenuilepis, Strain CCMP3274" /LENGTH=88 /DNA_ID=CAMNT_0010387961 /DNA_START=121 /DNA_END=383 /DNA_ORIENTATION=+
MCLAPFILAIAAAFSSSRAEKASGIRHRLAQSSSDPAYTLSSRAVAPAASTLAASAPASMSATAAPACPRSAASISGVRPSGDAAATS